MECQYSFGVTKPRWAQMFLPQRRKLRLLVLTYGGTGSFALCKTVFLLIISDDPIKL